MTMIRISTMLLAVSSWTATGFSPLSISSNNNQRSAFLSPSNMPSSYSTATTSSLYAGGFGGGGGAKKKKASDTKKDLKLKPKQQWDRYTDLKREPKVRVAVRIIEEDNNEWLEVGRIKSKESKYTEMAVFRQRAIIAEHARRLYPLKVTSKKTIEWGYFTGDDDNDEWKAVDKSSITDEVEGLEKLVGFEGKYKDCDSVRPAGRNLSFIFTCLHTLFSLTLMNYLFFKQAPLTQQADSTVFMTWVN